MTTHRESCLAYAQVCERAERFEEMATAMKDLVDQCPSEDLTVEERELLDIALKNVVGPKRASWRIILTEEEKQVSVGNDRLAALVSHLIGADLLILVSDIDSLYDAPPSDPRAERISSVVNVNELVGVEVGGVGSSGVGSGGMVTKIEAARISTGAGVSMLLTNLESLQKALTGADIGTIFHAIHDKRPSRLLWLAHAATPHGKLTLDDGAVTALLERGTSLLAAGVTNVSGEFSAGDAVDIARADGTVFARGLIAFDADEVPKMLGHSTKELSAKYGFEYERELIHRDDLVLL